MDPLKVVIGCGARSFLPGILRQIDLRQARVVALYERAADVRIAPPDATADVWLFDARMLRQLVRTRRDALVALRQASCIVLLLEPAEVRRAAPLVEHVHGVAVLLDRPPNLQMLVLRVACAGYAVLPAAVLSRDAAGAARAKLGRLSPRERAVLALVAQGLSNAAVAARLAIAPHRVRHDMRRILVKLELRNRTEAAVFAARQGLVPRRNADAG